jgi:hypothetical protein
MGALSPQAQTAQEQLDAFLQNGPLSVVQVEKNIVSSDRLIQSLTSSNTQAQVPLTELGRNPFHLDTETGTPATEPDRMTLLRAVEKLQLQSIVRSGNTELCTINGTLYHEGQQVNDFTVDTIADHSVIIRSGEYRFELKPQN